MSLRIADGPLTLGRGSGLSISGFNPLSISGLNLWLAADRITGLADGAAVASWADSSGNTRTQSQGTGANQPLYKTNILNGRPVVRFDGTNDSLSGAMADMAAHTMIAVVKQASGHAAAHQGLFRLTDGAASASKVNLFARRNAAGNFFAHWNTTDAWKESDLSLTYDTFYVLTWKYTEASSVSLYANGATRLNAASVASAIAAYSLLIIGSTTSGAEFFTGDIAELYLYGSALSDANRQKAERHLGRKYGITVA